MYIDNTPVVLSTEKVTQQAEAALGTLEYSRRDVECIDDRTLTILHLRRTRMNKHGISSSLIGPFLQLTSRIAKPLLVKYW